MHITRDSVRTYYEQNTRLFLAFSRSRKAENIHRTVWTDGARSIEDALNVINERIRAEIESVAPSGAHIADLGCEVGASLLHIVPRLKEPGRVLGLTLSPTQAQLARQFAIRSGSVEKVLFCEGDFTAVPLENESLDVIFSIESIVHTQELELYFQEAGRLLRHGGKLILVDDYQADRPLASHESKWLNAFIHGWHVPGVTTVQQSTLLAGNHRLQLIKNNDLTPYLQLRNLPSCIADVLLFIGNHIPIRHAILPSMLGSMALQQCLYEKIIEYRFLVFEKE